MSLEKQYIKTLMKNYSFMEKDLLEALQENCIWWHSHKVVSYDKGIGVWLS